MTTSLTLTRDGHTRVSESLVNQPADRVEQRNVHDACNMWYKHRSMEGERMISNKQQRYTTEKKYGRR